MMTMTGSFLLPAFFLGTVNAGPWAVSSGTSGNVTVQPQLQESVVPEVVFRRIPVEIVREQLLQWLALSRIDERSARRVGELWSDREQASKLSAEETLDLLIESFAVADDAVAGLVEACRSSAADYRLNYEGKRSQRFFRDHVQLYHAKWLVQHRFFDEAIDMLESLDPEVSADPASIFFYRAVCRLQLLRLSEASDDINLLMNNTLDVPARFLAVAELMREEAESGTEGLPQVARLMSDVQRRLDLGKADEPVQDREEEVIAALDKLLKEMEEQQKQQQQSSGQGGGQQQSEPGQQGAEQSTMKGTPGDGIADRKELAENGSWGMLDKQDEVQARELIRQQLPANFLDAINRYTRRIAEQKK